MALRRLAGPSRVCTQTGHTTDPSRADTPAIGLGPLVPARPYRHLAEAKVPPD